MKTSGHLVAGVSALALGIAALSTGAAAHTIYYPFKKGVHFTPQAGHVGAWVRPYKAPIIAKSGTWTDLTNKLPFSNGPWVQMLLTDGTVLVDDFCTPNWYKLTPDNKGRYENGTWSSIAAMPSGYQPLFFASEVLADGRMIINGGEYNGSANNNCGGGVWTNKGALYDPVADSWSSVSPPTGWSRIGDAQSAVLPDGSYMLANCCSNQEAIAAISGTSVTWTATGSGKADINDEEGWTLLPDGNLLTVDANVHLGSNPNQYEIYDLSAGTWSSPGDTAQELVDPGSHELGPAVLRPDGNVIYFGAVGHNDIYNTSTGTWTAGPDFPKSNGVFYDCADAPAVLLPNGKVLVQASPGVFNTPSHFWHFTITKKGNARLTQVDDPAQAGGTSSFEGVFLMLPTGQALWNDSQTQPNEIATYTAPGVPQSSWRPVISSVSKNLTVGSSNNAISGTNFNGFSQDSAYGDDAQMSTNWPIVRIQNHATNDVCYARSHDFSTMGVWTVGTTNAMFDIPSSCEKGLSVLKVVVNGIKSAGVAVTLK
jgi:hypothetical protein